MRLECFELNTNITVSREIDITQMQRKIQDDILQNFEFCRSAEVYMQVEIGTNDYSIINVTIKTNILERAIVLLQLITYELHEYNIRDAKLQAKREDKVNEN